MYAHQCLLWGVSLFPHGYNFCFNPPRQAISHSASVGRRFPTKSQYLDASFHETCITGCSILSADTI